MALFPGKKPAERHAEKTREQSYRQTLIDRLTALTGSFWVSPKGKTCRIEGGGLYIEETKSALPWGDVPLEGLQEILKENERHVLKSKPVTLEWVRNRIRERQAAGEDTRMEEEMMRWYFRMGPAPKVELKPVVEPAPQKRLARPEPKIEEVPF